MTSKLFVWHVISENQIQHLQVPALLEIPTLLSEPISLQSQEILCYTTFPALFFFNFNDERSSSSLGLGIERVELPKALFLQSADFSGIWEQSAVLKRCLQEWGLTASENSFTRHLDWTSCDLGEESIDFGPGKQRSEHALEDWVLSRAWSSRSVSLVCRAGRHWTPVPSSVLGSGPGVRLSQFYSQLCHWGSE